MGGPMAFTYGQRMFDGAGDICLGKGNGFKVAGWKQKIPTAPAAHFLRPLPPILL